MGPTESQFLLVERRRRPWKLMASSFSTSTPTHSASFSATFRQGTKLGLKLKCMHVTAKMACNLMVLRDLKAELSHQSVSQAEWQILIDD